MYNNPPLLNIVIKTKDLNNTTFKGDQKCISILTGFQLMHGLQWEDYHTNRQLNKSVTCVLTEKDVEAIEV